ncbi:alpha/beta hydrolase [Mycolicibacterium austroafricanum]|uniref:Alpha/beta hydrolase n=1 Tax=Mycolicibacterium austroafricanum TaxID=39687 RepID=A0ABT8HAB5_MYCAO|nr:alpha/beta hydrolase [Mycolicibacterium austroafricanum]MDN4517707.1 alpha/beta hydrolase [Mycolicibacterium austroafricanum]QRZ08900.1 alpha/beta hydrolase [Mycolicibacterium austroafricanum]QZT70675.1 alpha/beta hydrolase [Mycolicibacterium austroafricanum]
MSGWEPDVLPGYWQYTFALGPDPDGEGELEATLVRRGDPEPSARHAVLVVHGFTDYFFNTELADRFAARGFAFYALDLHKCGRSHREGQTPHFTTDLARYDVELERALDAIAAVGPARVLVYGHSAGGLVVSLWLDRLRARRATARKGVSGLVLNSPWLDLQGPAILRTPPTSVALMAMRRVRKHRVVRRPTEGGYGTTLHRDYFGEFEYNLQWKPVGGFPVTVGWIHAIRRAQSRLHRGLDVGVPNLILRSDRSVREVADPASIQRGDAVLDVAQIARWAGCIGNRTTVVPVTDAKHDVFLSLPEPRRAAYAELDRWLDWYLAETSATSPQSDGGAGHG